MFILIAFLIFSGALFGAAYYAFVVPQQSQNEVLVSRLRNLRGQAVAGRRPGGSSALLKSEARGSLAFLGDFFLWIAPLKRLQTYIYQANRKWQATEVFSLSMVLAGVTYFGLGLVGVEQPLFPSVDGAARGVDPNFLHHQTSRTPAA